MISPISLAGFHLDHSNTQLVVGLPDSETDFEKSWDRGGFAQQFRSPDEWRLTVKDAIKSGSLRDPGDVWRFFDYPTRRHELENLVAHGLNLSIGTSIHDLPAILSRPLTYTKFWTHTHQTFGVLSFEFVDGFLSCDALGQMIGQGKSGIIDFCACRAARCSPTLKRICPDRFFIAAPEELTGCGWGLHTTFFMKNVVQYGGTFPELWRMTLADLKELTSPRRKM